MTNEATSRTAITYRYEKLRSIAAGVLETAGTTFLLLIAVRYFHAGALAKGLVASGGSLGLMLGPVTVTMVARLGWSSSKAAAIMAGLGALVALLMAALPFLPVFVIGSILGTAIAFGLVAGCFLKGRILHGTVGIFVFPIALYGTCRIGKPNSAWARRRYGDRRPDKQAKAEERFAPERRTERFKEAFRDIVGGKPSEGLGAAREQAIAATREATAEVRHRAEKVTAAERRQDG